MAGRPVTVGYLGAVGERDRLRATAEERDLPVEITDVTTEELGGIDCLVVASTASPDWTAIEAVDIPIVVYADSSDHIDERAGDVSDALVQGGDSEDGGFLFAKVLGLTRTSEESDWKAREDELERYETIIQALGDPVCTFDEGGFFVYVNDAFEARTGYDAPAARGEPATLVMDEQAATKVIDRIERLRGADNGGTETVEIDLQDADGTTVPTECKVALLPSEDGSFQGSVAVLRDITRLKQREARLEKFASVVSHDLRNPMDVAIGRAEVLPEIADVDEQTERHLDDIYESLKRMEHLIQDVLTLTRARDEDLELSSVSLGAVATDAWSNVETEEATLSVEAGPKVWANESRLLRLLENLFRNAIEHAGDTVTVEVGLFDTDRNAGTTNFYIADDGPGIPTTDRDQIFDDGFSTSDEGTGLGLAIAREIANAHGWEITLADASDGARFDITNVSLGEF